MEKLYIHYGHKEFKRELFNPIINRTMFTKPDGGLWGSPLNSKNGWKQWCESEQFDLDRLNRGNFIFSISKVARVLLIDSSEILNNLPRVDTYELLVLDNWILLDFEKLMQYYDAVEVLISKDFSLYYTLYGWDCDSILIMNPDIVEVKNL